MSSLLLSRVIATAYGAALAIAAVSGNGVAPIQITTAAAHGYGSGDWVAVSGVQGNTAANVSDRATVIDSLNFTVPGTGNGAYTAGTGQAALYYGVANGLALAGHAPLIDSTAAVNADGRGGIPVGPQYLAESLDYPRLIVEPQDVAFGPRADFNFELLSAGPVIGAAATNPSIASMTLHSLCHVWGADFDDCLDLASQFVRSMMWTLSTGNFLVGDGKWLTTTKVDLRGRWLSFPMSWIAPVTRLPIAAPQATAPSGTKGIGTIYEDNSGNNPGVNPVTVS